ncbi:MAG: hypothetical protein FWJ70_07485 [Micromonosporaceae bacterium]|jgi:hypothetical protein
MRTIPVAERRARRGRRHRAGDATAAALAEDEPRLSSRVVVAPGKRTGPG